MGSSPTTRATGGVVARRVLLTSLFFTHCNGKMGASSLAVRGLHPVPRVAGVRPLCGKRSLDYGLASHDLSRFDSGIPRNIAAALRRVPNPVCSPQKSNRGAVLLQLRRHPAEGCVFVRFPGGLTFTAYSIPLLPF